MSQSSKIQLSPPRFCDYRHRQADVATSSRFPAHILANKAGKREKEERKQSKVGESDLAQF